MSDFEYERLAWWILAGAYFLLGYWLGYRKGWRDRIRASVRTVTSVQDGSTITITSASPPTSQGGRIRVGDKIEFIDMTGHEDWRAAPESLSLK